MAASVLTLMAAGCNDAQQAPSANGSRKVSDADMQVRLPDGSDLSIVDWDITGGPAMVARSGMVNVGNSATVRFRIGDLPVGDGYHIELEGTSSNGTACSGEADFDIENNLVTQVMLTLLCGDGVDDTDNVGDGEFDVDVVQNDGCPVITAITALPLEVYVGSSLELEAASTSATAAYMWSGMGGTFSSAGTAATDFTCTAPGDHELDITITDGACTDEWSVTVTCTPVMGGGMTCPNNIVEGTEQCDDGNSMVESCAYGQMSCTVCGAGCLNVPGVTSYCGDSIVDMANGEECEGASATCVNCQNVAGPTCGNGTTESPETCDDGNTVTEACAYGQMSCTVCGSSCTNVPGASTSYCGDGVVDAANGEDCDETSATCVNCETVVVGPSRGMAAARPGCSECRDLVCSDIDGNNLVTGCFQAPGNPMWQQECVDILDCGFVNDCAYGPSGAAPCWCGTATPTQCSQDMGINGPCMAQFTAATDAANNAQVNSRIRSLAYPSGYAVSMLECDRDYCTECVP